MQQIQKKKRDREQHEEKKIIKEIIKNEMANEEHCMKKDRYSVCVSKNFLALQTFEKASAKSILLAE